MTSDPVARYLAGRGARLAKRERLRAMTTGETLDMALRVYRNLGWTFLRLTVVPSLFCLGGIAFVLFYVLPSLFVTHHGADVNGQLAETAVAVSLALVVGGPLFLIGLAYISAVVIHMTSDYMLGKPIRPEQATKIAAGAVPALLRVSVRELALSASGILAALGIMGLGAVISQYTPSDSPLGGLVVLLGGCGLAAGAIIFLYVVSLHGLAPAVAVLENANGKEASKRSTWLMKAQWGHVSGVNALFNAFGLMLFAGIIEWAGFAALFAALDVGQHIEDLVSGSSVAGLMEATVGLIPPFLVIWTVLPVWAASVTIVYYERRIRLEGYDIEALAEEIGTSGRTSRFDV